MEQTLKDKLEELMDYYIELSKTDDEKADQYAKTVCEIAEKIAEIEKNEQEKKNKKFDFILLAAVQAVTPLVVKGIELIFFAKHTNKILKFEQEGHMELSTPGKGLGKVFGFKV